MSEDVHHLRQFYIARWNPLRTVALPPYKSFGRTNDLPPTESFMFALTLPTSVRDANATHVSAHPYGIGLPLLMRPAVLYSAGEPAVEITMKRRHCL
jgi:hypothetical protein